MSTCPQLASWDFNAWVCPFQLREWTALLTRQRCSRKLYFLKNTSLCLRHSRLRPVGPPPLNPGHMEAAGAELPIQGANSYAPFKTLLKCPCLKQRQLLPLRGHTALLLVGDGSAGSSPKALHGARHIAAQLEHVRGRGLGHLRYILFLILPFLACVPRPKAPRCSSRAWRRLRAESCLRPPLCRKRIFWARRLCFRICCLVLSSERTRPAGGPGGRGWEAPARTRIQGAQPLG